MTHFFYPIVTKGHLCVLYTIHKQHFISYTFLIADYESIIATLSYKSLWQFGEVCT